MFSNKPVLLLCCFAFLVGSIQQAFPNLLTLIAGFVAMFFVGWKSADIDMRLENK